MPSRVLFKDKNSTVEFKMEIVRYSSINSESGAYIFAPSNKGRIMKL